MTREEAIDVLKAYLMFDKSSQQVAKALDMAIEALSAEADGEDLIIKGAKGIKDGLYNIKDGKLFQFKAKGGTVRTYPIVSSADAVQGWITGKPTENSKYMVTLDAWGHRYIDIMHYAKPQMPNREVDGMCWYRSDAEYGDVVYDDNDILAWQSLPTPYKGGNDE